jgi:SAM-dependent methyltransferase
MTTKLEWVARTNEIARARGANASIVQFENIATQAQYGLPYQIAAKHVRPNDSVLDWGCGNGHFSLFLESLGARVTGYSFEAPPESMRDRPAFRFVPGNEREPRLLPFADACFQVVTGVGVLEHVWETGGDEPASLRELYRVLAPGGVLLTYHFPNAGGWIEKIVHALRPNKHFHRRKYDRQSIRELWTGAGFEISDIGLYNALPRGELRALPGFLKHTRAFAAAFDVIDGAIARLAPNVCTNFYVVARKPV